MAFNYLLQPGTQPLSKKMTKIREIVDNWGASQLIIRSTHHSLKLCDELTEPMMVCLFLPYMLIDKIFLNPNNIQTFKLNSPIFKLAGHENFHLFRNFDMMNFYNVCFFCAGWCSIPVY